MRRHGPVIAHCTDSEDFPALVHFRTLVTLRRVRVKVGLELRLGLGLDLGLGLC